MATYDANGRQVPVEEDYGDNGFEAIYNVANQNFTKWRRVVNNNSGAGWEGCDSYIDLIVWNYNDAHYTVICYAKKNPSDSNFTEISNHDFDFDDYTTMANHVWFQSIALELLWLLTNAYGFDCELQFKLLKRPNVIEFSDDVSNSRFAQTSIYLDNIKSDLFPVIIQVNERNYYGGSIFRINNAKRKRGLFHEMGHCLLNWEHSEDGIMTSGIGDWPVSNSALKSIINKTMVNTLNGNPDWVTWSEDVNIMDHPAMYKIVGTNVFNYGDTAYNVTQFTVEGNHDYAGKEILLWDSYRVEPQKLRVITSDFVGNNRTLVTIEDSIESLELSSYFYPGFSYGFKAYGLVSIKADQGDYPMTVEEGNFGTFADELSNNEESALSNSKRQDYIGLGYFEHGAEDVFVIFQENKYDVSKLTGITPVKAEDTFGNVVHRTTINGKYTVGDAGVTYIPVEDGVIPPETDRWVFLFIDR